MATKQKSGIAAALDLISSTTNDLCSLDGLASGFLKGSMDCHTLDAAVSAITSRCVSAFREASGKVPSNKQAVAYLEKACAALDAADCLTGVARDSAENDDTILPRAFRRMVAKALRAFTSESGRYMERTEIALGETYGRIGYTSDGYMLDGGEGMRLLSDVDRQALTKLGTSKTETR